MSAGPLADEVVVLGSRLGVGMDRTAVGDAVAGLSLDVATALSWLIVRLGLCATRTDAPHPAPRTPTS